MKKHLCIQRVKTFTQQEKQVIIDNDVFWKDWEEYNKKDVALEVKCTVAGLPKNTFKTFAKQLGNDEAFKRFEPDLTFDISGKNAHKYNNETTAIIAGETMHEYGSCYIYSVGFCMRVDSGFLLIISKRKEITQ